MENKSAIKGINIAIIVLDAISIICAAFTIAYLVTLTNSYAENGGISGILALMAQYPELLGALGVGDIFLDYDFSQFAKMFSTVLSISIPIVAFCIASFGFSVFSAIQTMRRYGNPQMKSFIKNVNVDAAMVTIITGNIILAALHIVCFCLCKKRRIVGTPVVSATTGTITFAEDIPQTSAHEKPKTHTLAENNVPKESRSKLSALRALPKAIKLPKPEKPSPAGKTSQHEKPKDPALTAKHAVIKEKPTAPKFGSHAK